MTPAELTSILVDNISMGLRHANYDRTLAVKKFSKMITTGEGQSDEVTRYRRFEEDDLKEQRNRLYNPLTKYAVSIPRKLWKQMLRVEGIRRTFTTKDEAGKKALTELQTDFYNFMPGEALEQWQGRTLEFLGVTDPNAWIVYERNDSRNVEGVISKTKVYPVVVSCENVLNFQKSFGVLDWLIIRNVRIERVLERNAPTDKVLEDFYLYSNGLIVRMREAGGRQGIQQGEKEVGVSMHMESGMVDPTGKSSPTAIKSTKQRNFYQKIIGNGTTEVPAECVGVYFDEMTNQQTFVTWFDQAEDLLKDLIRYKSVGDVVFTTYAFPKDYEYAKQCKFVSPEFGQCERGYYSGIRDNEHICGSCNGSGEMAGFTTEQAKIRVVLPDNVTPTELIQLSQLSYTQPIDVPYLTWLYELQNISLARFMSAVFDAGLVQRPTNTTSKTATEVNHLVEGISNVLAPFGALDSRHFELAYRVGAQYRNFALDVDKSYPEDLRIEMLPDMVEAFNKMKSSGVGYEAMRAQRGKVNQKVFEGNPGVQKQIEARYKFLPFDDKTEQQAAMILSGLSPADPTYILWAYWKPIFEEIENADPVFYQKTYDLQKKIVDAKTTEFAQRVVLMEQSEPPNFNDPANAIDPAQDANA